MLGKTALALGCVPLLGVGLAGAFCWPQSSTRWRVCVVPERLHLRLADAVAGVREAVPGLDHLEIAYLKIGQFARVEQTVPLGLSEPVALGGQSEVTCVG